MSLGESYLQVKMALQTGSYLIELDENGDVENYTVTTHGTEFSAPSGDAQRLFIIIRFVQEILQMTCWMEMK